MNNAPSIPQEIVEVTTGRFVINGLPPEPDANTTTPPPVDQLRFSLEDLGKANLNPRCLVERYLYADVAGFAAAGGTGKTTLAIYEAVHIALGRPLYGLRVANPGAALFVTAEDRRETFAARLREIMKAMELDDEERQRVLDRFLVWDVTGSDLRLACVTDNMIVLTGLADRIVEAYRDAPPVMVIFDPLVSFGADEGRFNANEQAIITASRRLVAGLGCCVRLIAHTGKGNARDGALDQYGFRGGSALADGSRMMVILQPWKPDQSTGGLTPPATLARSARSSITILSRAKLSYCEPQPLLWIARDGWTFSYAVDVRTSPDEARRAKREQVLTFLTDQLKAGRRYSLTSLEPMVGIMSLTRNELRNAVAELKSSGSLLDVVLPKEEQHGRKQTYLCPAGLLSVTMSPATDDGGMSAKTAQNEVPEMAIPPDSINPPPYREKNGGGIEPPIFALFPGIPPNITAECGGIGGIGEVAIDEPLEWVEEEF